MPKITGTPADREEIRELYARYAITVDHARFDEWIDCFTPDGVFESPIYGTFAGQARLREFSQGYQQSWEGGQVRHMMVNVSFDVDGDTATGRCNLIYFSIKGGKSEFVTTGGYEDRLRRHDGEWRFAHRRVWIDK